MADAISRQAFSDLIGSIYDCALDPSRWERTLAEIMDALDCDGIILTLSDLRYDRLLLHKAVAVEPDHIERLSKHLPELHALFGQAVASLPSSDEPHVVSRHFSPSYVESSSFFQEWQKPIGTVDSMHLFLMHTPAHHAGLGVGRNERQGLITEREITLAKLLVPHLPRPTSDVPQCYSIPTRPRAVDHTFYRHSRRRPNRQE